MYIHDNPHMHISVMDYIIHSGCINKLSLPGVGIGHVSVGGVVGHVDCRGHTCPKDA